MCTCQSVLDHLNVLQVWQAASLGTSSSNLQVDSQPSYTTDSVSAGTFCSWSALGVIAALSSAQNCHTAVDKLLQTLQLSQHHNPQSAVAAAAPPSEVRKYLAVIVHGSQMYTGETDLPCTALQAVALLHT